MLVLIMATIINTVLMTLQALFEFLTEDCHLLAASMLQVPRPMDVPFNPSTSCQGAHHVFVVFLLHHGLTVGVPAVVGRLGLVLDTGLGFWGHDGRTTDGRRMDGRNRAPPQTPLVLRTGNRNGTRISIPVYLRFQQTNNGRGGRGA